MPELLQRFIESFQKAITVEMEAMRQRLGPFEVPLVHGQVVTDRADERARFYRFEVLKANDKLVLNLECSLVYPTGEALVTIAALEGNEVVLTSDRPLDVTQPDQTLVLYPWFLYERLKLALASLLDTPDFYVDNALTLFGKGQPSRQPRSLRVDHAELNASQHQAVQLCCDSSLAFVWGPPGTGKTMTLGHIVTELLSQGQRLLITSTTNAAVDQALAKLAALPESASYFEAGQIVRLGQTEAETYGTSLYEVVRRLNAETQAELTRLRQRRLEIARQIKAGTELRAKVEAQSRPLQLGFFEEIKSDGLTLPELRSLFSVRRAAALAEQSPGQQRQAIEVRLRRLETVAELGQTRLADLSRHLGDSESTVVHNARVVLATMTNVYLSSLLSGDRFDGVIVEEAGMAILPTLFYCAALARSQVIVVGDPRQLPPIVQSSADYVYRAMGRSIFEVTVPDPYASNIVALLDIQYRMHPLIGNLVSDLFYEGRLRHGENTRERQLVADKQPFAGAPLVVVDTQSRTTCTTPTGSFSRFNERTAQACVELAVEAVRNGVESVAIITPYVEQSRLIRRQLARFPGEVARIECQTVHRFQGNERDVVILDTVDTAPLAPGVLLAGRAPTSSAPNLINVSLSRARGKLIIISDVGYFEQHAPHSVLNTVLQRAMQAGLRHILHP